jgi:CRISPR/Cas system Type II protein with McrA/HNH and RuvC-like nuclease domain
VKITSDTQQYFAYYVKTDRSTAAIALCAHDKDPSFGKEGLLRIGVKTLLGFEKYTVDVLGNISKQPIVKEVRCGVAYSDDSESSEIALI